MPEHLPRLNKATCIGANKYILEWTERKTAEELIKLRDVDVTNVDRDTLVDLQDIRINDKLSVDERIASFIEQIKNPYCFKVDGVVVKVAFSSGGKSFNEQFEQMILGFS